MNQLESRVKKLEKSLHTYRIIFGSIIVFFMAFMLMSSGKKNDVPDIVKAKAFEVVDDRGNVLMLLNKEAGSGQLATYNSSGKKLIKLFATDDGGSGAINTYDEGGNLNFKVNSMTSGGGYMALYNSTGNAIMEAGSSTSKSGFFNVNDNAGEKLVWLTRTSNGGGYISVSDDQGEKMIISTQNGGSRLNIYNRDKNRVCYLGAQDDQTGNLSLYSSGGSFVSGLPK